MALWGEQEKGPPEKKQRWEFINLSDFKSRNCWTHLAYGWLWLMAFVGIAVYAVDTFTAVNLLAFNKWSSQITPLIPFEYSKWIFAVCILLSWTLCIYEWIRAIRVIKRNGVAASYMDPLAMSLQSMRGQGWKRFLVFTELTKSKKGTDYVAFFVYFAFQGALRVIICEGPRQVVNGITLWSIMENKLINGGKQGQDANNIEQFFSNLKALADQNYQQAIILSSMLFTLTIWIFSAICLLIAGVLYLVFLWHYIPQRDGRLRIYCRRKIDRRLEKIVEHKVKAAIEEENRLKEKAERKAELKRQKNGELPPPGAPPKLARQPTLPDLGASLELKSEDKLPGMPLQRQDTQTTVSTLPVYSSRPSTRQGIERQPTLPDLSMGVERPSMPSRTATQGSGWSRTSFESNAPLLSNAGFAGGDSSAPPYSRQNSSASSFRPMPARTGTQSTHASSQRSFTPISRNDSSMSRPPPGFRAPMRSNTGFSFDQEPQSAISPISPIDSYGRPLVPLPRQNTSDSFHSAPIRQDSQASYFSQRQPTPTSTTPGPGMERRPTYSSLHSQQSFSRPMPRNPSQASSFHRPFTPGQPTPPGMDSYEMTSQPSYSSLPSAGMQRSESNEYVAFNPNAVQAGGQQQRSVTMPNDFHAGDGHGYGDIIDDYRSYDTNNDGLQGSRSVSQPQDAWRSRF